MKIQTLLSRLPADSFHIIHQNNTDMEIYALQTCTNDMTDFHPHILYLCSGSLPSCPVTQPVFFLCIQKDYESISRQPTSNGPSVIYYTGSRSLAQISRLLQDIIYEDQNYRSAVSVLTEIFFSGYGLDYLTETVSSILGGPVFVLSETNRFISAAGISEKHSRDKLLCLIEECSTHNSSEHKPQIYCGYSHILECKFLFLPVKINTITVGRILFLEQQQEIRQNTHLLLEQFSHFVSLELQKEQIDRHYTKTIYSFLLSDLLDGREINYSDIENQLAGSGINLQDDLYIMTVSTYDYCQTCTHLNETAEQLCSMLKGSIYTIYENILVFLFSRPAETPLSEQELEVLSDQLTAQEMQAGISNFFTDIRNVHRFYVQARKAVEIGARLNQATTLFFYSDIYFYHIMEICKEKEELRYFIHPAMMKLLASDMTKHSDLLNTLHVFLEQACSTSQTAAILHIHKNTLLYRMNRIKELTGCDLSNGDELLSMAFSYKIMKYLKMLPESITENNTKK